MGKVFPAQSALSTVKRYWWAALVAFTSVFGTSVAYLATTPKLYETSARLIVEDKKISVSNLGQAITEIDTASSADPIVTQAELVKSQGVLQQALEIYQQETAQPAEQLPSIADLQAGIRVKIIPATNILELAYISEDPEATAGLVNAIATAAVAENTQAIRSEAAAVRSFLEAEIPQQQAKLRQAETAESQYRQASGIVSLETQSQSLVESLAALEQEQRDLLAQLQQANTRNQLLQQVTEVETPASAYIASRVGQDEGLQSLQQQLTDLEVAIVEARSRLGDQHPELLALLDQRQDLRQLYSQRLSQVGFGQTSPGQAGDPSSNPATNPLSQDLIAQYITGQIESQALQSRLQVVQAELSSLQSRVAQLPIQGKPLADLVRQREEAEVSLKLLQSKLEEARIAEAQLVSNIRVVGQAEVPFFPIAPKPASVLLLGIVAGGVLGTGILLLLNALDGRVHSAIEVEESLKLPILGQLPKLPSALLNREDSLEQFLNHPSSVEPYRSLLKVIESTTKSRHLDRMAMNASAVGAKVSRSLEGRSLDGLRADTRPILITVSSIAPGAGKSTVALYLAAVAAMLSRRTLLVDADLRYPLQHQLLSLPPSPGLTEAIQGQCALTEAIRSTAIEQLSVLPQGSGIERPAALIESQLMRTLLSDVAADYDLIVVDTSPTGICADAATLSQLTDGLVLVTRPEFTQREVLTQIVSDLQKKEVPLLGVVFNQVVLPLENRATAKRYSP